MNRLFRKFSNTADVVRTFRNWPMLLICYSGLFKTGLFSIGPHMVCTLYNGARFNIRTRLANLDDAAVIIGTYTVNTYHDISRKHIVSNSVVIDIGAHIGVFSVMAATKGENIRVFAYEPEPENFSLLQDNIRLNGLENNITAFDMAVVGEKSESVRKLNITDSPETYSLYYSDGGKGIDVRCITLESILADNKIERCDFLKMDCEGAEYDILLNAPQNILSRIKKIHLEYHEFPERISYDHNDLIKKLINAGFTLTTRSWQPRYGYIYAERAEP